MSGTNVFYEAEVLVSWRLLLAVSSPPRRAALGRKRSLANVRFWPEAALRDRQKSARSGHSHQAVFDSYRLSLVDIHPANNLAFMVNLAELLAVLLYAASAAAPKLGSGIGGVDPIQVGI